MREPIRDLLSIILELKGYSETFLKMAFFASYIRAKFPRHIFGKYFESSG